MIPNSANDDSELIINIVIYISEDIGMDFGLDKYTKVTFTETHLVDPDFVTKIRELGQEEAYKYLGFSEGI